MIGLFKRLVVAVESIAENQAEIREAQKKAFENKPMEQNAEQTAKLVEKVMGILKGGKNA